MVAYTVHDCKMHSYEEPVPRQINTIKLQTLNPAYETSLTADAER
jgi:hypothetical protein